jgi:hypothetical protein
MQVRAPEVERIVDAFHNQELIGWTSDASNRDPGISPDTPSNASSRNQLPVRYSVHRASGAHIPGSTVDRPACCSRSFEFWPSP